MVKILREKTDLKMARIGSYRRSAVCRPCGVTPHAALQKKRKSVVCSGSRVTNSTVMKLHGSDNQGGINVKTYTKSTCSHMYLSAVTVTLPHTCFTQCSHRHLTPHLFHALQPQPLNSTPVSHIAATATCIHTMQTPPLNSTPVSHNAATAT